MMTAAPVTAPPQPPTMLTLVLLWTAAAAAAARLGPAHPLLQAPPPFVCPDTTGLYPDIYDCTSYYQCDFGKATHEHCPPMLEWNRKLHVCELPQDIDPPCVPISTPAPMSTPTPMSTHAEDFTAAPTTPHPSPWFQCPTQFGLYPNIYDCSTYYQCSYGHAYLERCQPGLQYNAVMKYCDYPQNIHPPCVPKPYPTMQSPPTSDTA